MESDGSATTGSLLPFARPGVALAFPASQPLDRITRSLVAKLWCSASQINRLYRARLDQTQEGSMTLTILDPRSGQTVTIRFEDAPAVRQSVPAKIVAHSRAAASRT